MENGTNNATDFQNDKELEAEKEQEVEEEEKTKERHPSLLPSSVELPPMHKSKLAPIASHQTSPLVVDDRTVTELNNISANPSLFNRTNLKVRRLIVNAAALLNAGESNWQLNPSLVAASATLALSATI